MTVDAQTAELRLIRCNEISPQEILLQFFLSLQHFYQNDIVFLEKIDRTVLSIIV